MPHLKKLKLSNDGQKKNRSKKPKTKNGGVDENSSYASVMMKKAMNPNFLDKPSRFPNRFFLYDAVMEIFPTAKKSELLPNGAIKVFFNKKDDLESAKAISVAAFGNNWPYGKDLPGKIGNW